MNKHQREKNEVKADKVKVDGSAGGKGGAGSAGSSGGTNTTGGFS
jgi:hypothetical protein